MTQEQKELLLKDISARLPYKPQVEIIEDGISITSKLTTTTIKQLEYGCWNVKPYLFPMSSMTEEQKKVALFDLNMIGYTIDKEGYIESDEDINTTFLNINHIIDFINWCYENHIDINGLIPKGLAIDATGKNIY